MGLHGKAAAEALQSGAERVRRELQAAVVGRVSGGHWLLLVGMELVDVGKIWYKCAEVVNLDEFGELLKIIYDSLTCLI